MHDENNIVIFNELQIINGDVIISSCVSHSLLSGTSHGTAFEMADEQKTGQENTRFNLLLWSERLSHFIDKIKDSLLSLYR